MRQLALDISRATRPTLDRFVPGRNAELLAVARRLAAGTAAERFVYLWGETGSGRSHLLRACAAAAADAGLRSCLYAPPLAAAVAGADVDFACVDDVHLLDESGQQALFVLYNRLRDRGGALLAAGSVAPAGLTLRPDVVTRLAWGLVYEVHPLSDAEKAAAMAAHAAGRGFALPADVADYLLRHGRRDLPSLLAAIDRLDRRSLEARRAVTVPLAREVLRDPDAAPSGPTGAALHDPEPDA